VADLPAAINRREVCKELIALRHAADQFLQDLISLGVHGEGGGARVLPVRVIPQMIQQLGGGFVCGHPQGDVLGD
jgi:hypothetical protein